MLGNEIIIAINKCPLLKQHFWGITCIDKIPKALKIRHFIICNTDLQSGPGEHWFLIYKHYFDTLEILDSLGMNDYLLPYVTIFTVN